MALISDLIIELSVMSGIAEASIAVVARRLREDGLLSQKGRGRGAAQATPLDAARLCIALMIGGKAKDASTIVHDFGGLRVSQRAVAPEHVYGVLSLEAIGVPPAHTYEEGLAGLIAAWGDEKVVAMMEELAAPTAIWPVMLARLSDSGMTGRIAFGASDYVYNHPALIRANQTDDSDVRLAQTEEYLEASRRYLRGIRSTREISGVEILPLGEVVAGLRRPGWRESEEAAIQRMIETSRHEASAARKADFMEETQD
jgi:hypothetical protein